MDDDDDDNVKVGNNRRDREQYYVKGKAVKLKRCDVCG